MTDEAQPGQAVVPADPVAAEIAQIQPLVGTPAYWKDEGLRNRYRDLLVAREGGTAAPAKDAHADEMRAIQAKMRDGSYWRTPALQARYRELIDLQLGNHPDPAGADAWRASPAEAKASLDPTLIAEWGESYPAALRRVQDAGAAILGALEGKPAQTQFLTAFAGLPDKVQSAIFRQLALPEPGFVRALTDRDRAMFNLIEGAGQIRMMWGRNADRRTGIVLDRVERIERSLSAADLQTFDYWWKHQSPRERQAMAWALGA